MDREHERRVSQLAALFGSDTNGHLRTNRNLTELWSQFDSRRRGALDQSEFTACLEFMASRSSPPTRTSARMTLRSCGAGSTSTTMR
eukprot:COSAG02_NODE_14794_length_1235_cov_2.487676_3_plen_86_part_01